MIKVKHLIWIICLNTFFLLANIATQVNFIISLNIFAQDSEKQNMAKNYKASSYLFSYQNINFHFIILSIIIDAIFSITNIIQLGIIYKYPYSMKISHLNLINLILLVLKAICSIASHIQDMLSFEKDEISPQCIESDSASSESKAACNLIFSQKFYIILLYVTVFTTICMVISFRFYYNIFLTQPVSAQSPLSSDLQLPLQAACEEFKQKKGSKLFVTSQSPSYLTNLTTKKSSGKLDPQTIKDLELSIIQMQQANQKKKFNQFTQSQCNPYTSNQVSNEGNFFSNQVKTLEYNYTSCVVQTNNTRTKNSSVFKNTENDNSSQQGTEDNTAENPENNDSNRLFQFNKKNKTQAKMERPTIKNSQSQIVESKRGSFSSQIPSFGLSSIQYPSNQAFSRLNTNQNISQISNTSPKRFSLSLYKCTPDPLHSPIKVFNHTDYLHSSLILNFPSQQHHSGQPQAMSDCYDESTFEFCQQSQEHNVNDRNQQHNHEKGIPSNILEGHNQKNQTQMLMLKKAASSQIYEESEEDDRSYQASSQQSDDSSDNSMNKSNDLNDQALQVSPNKYFRTDRQQINPVALAPSAGILSKKAAEVTANQLGNIVQAVVSNPGPKPSHNIFQRVFESITK